MQKLWAHAPESVTTRLHLAHQLREAELAREWMLAEVRMHEMSASGQQLYVQLQLAHHEVNSLQRERTPVEREVDPALPWSPNLLMK